jgi:glycosyltransferase involved in cell wall biosynthesis
MKVTLLAWSRESGGAERQFVNLARGLKRRGHDVLVIVFFSNRYVETPLQEAGVPCRVLDVRGRWDVGRYFFRFLAEMLKRDHQIVYSFLQAPNLLTVPFKFLRRNTKIVWGIRNSDLGIRSNVFGGLATWFETRLSSLADLVIANSFKGCSDAIALRFDQAVTVVIQNGIDTELFRPDPVAGARIRAEWGIGTGRRVIGLVGRFEARKGHDDFLLAAAIASQQREDLEFVCVGDGLPAELALLKARAQALGLSKRVYWPGFSWDMPGAYAGLDVVTLSSAFGEGFPNVVAEAMACGTPCVTTDVGDAAQIVGDLGWVVPARAPQALSEAWLKALEEQPDSGKRLLRRHKIVENYGFESMIERTEQALQALLEPGLKSGKP